MAIIDLDEYIVPVQEDNIKDFLRPYEKFSGVVVNWVMFDSNGIIKRPEGKSVIELFTRVPKDYQYYRNKTVKSIVKPGDVRYLNSVHVCIYKKGKYEVNELEKRADAAEQKYQELYKAFQETQRAYQFYSAPQLESYLETETLFESQIRRCLRNEREEYLACPEQTDELLTDLITQSYGLFQDLMQG